MSAYATDRSLMESLGLRTHGFGRDWTDLGTVTVEEAEPEGEYGPRPAAIVRVEVLAMPAQFWQFTVTRPRDDAETIDGVVRGIYEPLEIRTVTTGSGSFSEYWPVARMIAENCLDVEVGGMSVPEDRCPTCGVPLSEPVQSDNCPIPEDHAQRPAEPIPASISIDEDGLGDYTARGRVTDTYSWQPHSEFSVSLDTLYTMRLHIDNAIRGLEERRLRDAIAGSCDLCSNTRMVRVERHGHQISEHCPICRPKLDEALAALQHGLSGPRA